MEENLKQLRDAELSKSGFGVSTPIIPPTASVTVQSLEKKTEKAYKIAKDLVKKGIIKPDKVEQLFDIVEIIEPLL